MILPTDDDIKAALWEHAHSDLSTDTINYLFAKAIDTNKLDLIDEEDYDELFDKVAERFHEVMGG